jgi:hypothetical protein
MLVIDAANVVGARPTGWWRDRAGAARDFVSGVRAATRDGRLDAPVTVVLEGQARDGAPVGTADDVEVVHARGSGDDTIVELVAAYDAPATVVSADRALGDRVRTHGATVVGPTWLLERLEPS